MSPGPEESKPDSVGAVLGPDRLDQITLYEADLKRHEEALGNIGRTETAIRGFAITAVAALIAAAYASGERGLGFVALAIGAYFGFLDYYWSRLDAELSERIGFLSELAQRYRSVLAGGVRRRRNRVLKLEEYLSSFDPFGAIPTKPVLCMAYRNWRDKQAWTRRRARAEAKGVKSEGEFKPSKAPPIGPFKQFCFLYLALAVIALATGLSSSANKEREIILCRPSGQIAAHGVGELNLRGCVDTAIQAPPPRLAARVHGR